MALDVASLTRHLKKDGPAATYLICGEEEALVDRAVALVSQQVLGPSGAADFSLTRIDAKSGSASEVEAAARTASLFGGRRLIIVRDAQSFAAAEQKKLAVYLAAPVSASTLIMVVRGAGPKTRDPKLAKAKKAALAYAKAIEKGGGQVVDCPRPKARDLPRLAASLLSEQGLEADRDGLYALVDAVGEDLGGLWQAVEKLSLFKGGQGRVTGSDVSEVVADTRSQSVFDMTDAVAEGDQKKALSGLRRMIRDGESPLGILGHLARHFRNLTRVKAMGGRGESADAIRAALGLHPFVVKKSIDQGRRFSIRALARKLDRLAAADRELKGGALPDQLELERLVRALCDRDADAPRG